MSQKFDIKQEDVLSLGLHLGRSARFTNRTMEPFIIGNMNNISILDPNSIISQFENALEFLKESVKAGKKILFISTNLEYSKMIQDLAKATDQFSYTYKLIGGLLTNWYTVYKSIELMKENEENLKNIDSSEIQYTKKELAQMKKEFNTLFQKMNGIRDMKRRPDVVVLFETNEHNKLILKEAKLVHLSTVAFIDTNFKLENVDYPIPANNSSEEAVKFCVERIQEAILSVEKEVKKDNNPREDKTKKEGERKTLTLGSKIYNNTNNGDRPFARNNYSGNRNFNNNRFQNKNENGKTGDKFTKTETLKAEAK